MNIISNSYSCWICFKILNIGNIGILFLRKYLYIYFLTWLGKLIIIELYSLHRCEPINNFSQTTRINPCEVETRLRILRTLSFSRLAAMQAFTSNIELAIRFGTIGRNKSFRWQQCNITSCTHTPLPIPVFFPRSPRVYHISPCHCDAVSAPPTLPQVRERIPFSFWR